MPSQWLQRVLSPQLDEVGGLRELSDGRGGEGLEHAGVPLS